MDLFAFALMRFRLFAELIFDIFLILFGSAPRAVAGQPVMAWVFACCNEKHKKQVKENGNV